MYLQPHFAISMGKSSVSQHAINKKNAARAKQKRKRAKNKNPDVTHEYITDFPTTEAESGGFYVPQPPPVMYVSGSKKSVQQAHKAQVHGRMQKRAYKHKKKLRLHEMPEVGDEGGDMYGNTVRFHTPDAWEGLTPYKPKLKHSLAY